MAGCICEAHFRFRQDGPLIPMQPAVRQGNPFRRPERHFFQGKNSRPNHGITGNSISELRSPRRRLRPASGGRRFRAAGARLPRLSGVAALVHGGSGSGPRQRRSSPCRARPAPSAKLSGGIWLWAWKLHGRAAGIRHSQSPFAPGAQALAPAAAAGTGSGATGGISHAGAARTLGKGPLAGARRGRRSPGQLRLPPLAAVPRMSVCTIC